MDWENLTQPQAVLFAAAVGAGGAILGGFLASILNHALGLRGQRRRHWDEIRHVGYAKVAEAFHAAWAMYDDNGYLQVDRATERRAGDDLLSAYSRAILLTKKTATATALEDLHRTAQELWARPDRPWDEIEEACREAELKFRRSARLELGMPSGGGAPVTGRRGRRTTMDPARPGA